MNSATGWAMAAGFCILAIPGALAQNSALPDSVPATARAAAARAELPAASGPQLRGPAELTSWSHEEIALAQAHCSALLKGLDVVAVPEVPIREGTCGAPAPMKLISIGKSPQIAFSPPPTVTCDMVAALHEWLLHDVQPLARTHLGAPVIRVEAMSAYSCRNAYGRINGRLSEHGRANALDIAAFTTARGRGVQVVADWGPTAREITAAARGEAARATNSPPAALDHRQSPQVASPMPRPQSAEPSPAWRQPGLTFGMPGLSVAFGATAGRDVGLAASPPSHLGGPRPAVTPSAGRPVLPGDKTDFLRGAHRAACKIFGTVLGPEANNAHKNHFHIDMAERKVTVICE